MISQDAPPDEITPRHRHADPEKRPQHQRCEEGDPAEAHRGRRLLGDELAHQDAGLLEGDAEVPVHQVSDIAQQLLRDRPVESIVVHHLLLIGGREVRDVEGVARHQVNQQKGDHDERQQRHKAHADAFQDESQHSASDSGRFTGTNFA